MSSSSSFPHVPVLVIRVVLGGSLLFFHGWGKITGGPERWHALGGEMGNLGITFLPTFWGFMGAFSESVAAGLVALGVFFRPAAFLVSFTMLVAVVHHVVLPAGDPSGGWPAASHALELGSVFLALLLAGPGRYRVPFPPAR